MRKSNYRLISLIVLLCSLAIFVSAASAVEYDSKVVYGGEFTLNTGDKIKGDLAVFGGNVTLENGSEVDGDIAFFGGTLTIDGFIDGDVVTLGGTLDLKDNAVIDGDLNSIGTDNKREIGAEIRGNTYSQSFDVDTISGQDLRIYKDFNVDYTSPHPGSRSPLQVAIRFLSSLVGFIAKICLFSVLAIVAMLVVAKPISEVEQAMNKRPWESFGIGLLVFILLPIVFVLFCVTIFLIPAALLLLVLFLLACLYAWFVIGFYTGKKIAVWLKLDLEPIWLTAIGTFVSLMLSDGLAKLIPCIGWMPGFFVLCFGLGAAFIKHLHLFKDKTAAADTPLINAPQATAVKSAMPEAPLAQAAQEPVAPEVIEMPASQAVEEVKEEIIEETPIDETPEETVIDVATESVEPSAEATTPDESAAEKPVEETTKESTDGEEKTPKPKKKQE